jgi:hypothetical protein
MKVNESKIEGPVDNDIGHFRLSPSFTTISIVWINLRIKQELRWVYKLSKIHLINKNLKCMMVSPQETSFDMCQPIMGNVSIYHRKCTQKRFWVSIVMGVSKVLLGLWKIPIYKWMVWNRATPRRRLPHHFDQFLRMEPASKWSKDLDERRSHYLLQKFKDLLVDSTNISNMY